MRRQFLMRVVRRFAKMPATVLENFVDRIVVPAWLSLHEVQWGSHCRFAGIPVINRVPGATIRIGSHVALLSRFNSNPRGIQSPTILSAMKSNAVIEIGDHSGMSGVSICSRERVTIGSWVQIGPGVCIWDNDAHSLNPSERRNRSVIDHRCAPVMICDDVFIGTRSLILKGVTIGVGAVVGAGAVVSKNVAPYDIVAGNPARVVGTIEKTLPGDLNVDDLEHARNQETGE